MRIVIIISLVLLSITACKHGDDLFKSYGPETTKSRKVESFTKIQAGEKFDIELIQDSTKEGQIEITAGKNVIDGYTTKVKNGELFIINENKFNWVRKLKIRQKVVIYFKEITHLTVLGSAKFYNNDTINQKRIDIKHNGLENVNLNIQINDVYIDAQNTGGIILKGSSYLYSASVDDISFVDCRQLITDDCYLTTFSKADNYVDANNVLKIISYGTGNTYYSKNPNTTIDLKTLGSGKIIKN